jgi:transposase
MTPRRYELSDFEWSIIEPLLLNKPRGVPRSDDREVLNGIYWRLRTGSPWADIPERYGPATTCYNRLVCWAKIGGKVIFGKNTASLPSLPRARQKKFRN